jgi:hypothetical protein
MGCQIDYVVSNDWEGVYVNNVLVWEGYVAYLYEVMPRLLYKSYDRFSMHYADHVWIQERGVFPLLFDEVVLEGATKTRG